MQWLEMFVSQMCTEVQIWCTNDRLGVSIYQYECTACTTVECLKVKDHLYTGSFPKDKVAGPGE